jgi:hypothetical protein
MSGEHPEGFLPGIDDNGVAYKPTPGVDYGDGKPAQRQPVQKTGEPQLPNWARDFVGDDEPEEGWTREERRDHDRIMNGSGLAAEFPEPQLDGYELTSTDKEIFDGVREVAHRHKVPPAALQEMAELVLDLNLNMAGEEFAEAGGGGDTEAVMRQAWKEDFDKNLSVANRAFEHFATPDLWKALKTIVPGTSMRLGDFPPLVRTFERIGRTLPYDAIPGEFTGGRVTQAQGGMPGTRREAQRQVDEIYRNNPVGSPGYRSAKTQAVLKRLFEILGDGEQR